VQGFPPLLEAPISALVLHPLSALLVQVLWLRNRRGDPQLVDNPDALKLARKLPALNSRSHHCSVSLARDGGAEAFDSGEDALTSGCKVQVSSMSTLSNKEQKKKTKNFGAGHLFATR